MKNTQKKKTSRSYHLLTKVESGKCRRVTAAIDVIVTLCRKSGENESAIAHCRNVRGLGRVSYVD